MSRESYSIPQGPTARYDFQRTAIEQTTAMAAAWGIPTDMLATIAQQQSVYQQRYGVANNKNTQSKVAIADRDEAWSLLAASLVELYNQYLVNNNVISAAEKMALNLHTSSGRGGTVTAAAITTPVVILVAEEASVLHVVFTDSASVSGSHAKPDGVAFCEIWAKIDGPAPTAPTDCTAHYNIARSHEGIVFTPEQRTKPIYGFARWVNKNGKVGIWGNVFSAIIP